MISDLVTAVVALSISCAPLSFSKSIPIVDHASQFSRACKQMQAKRFIEATITLTNLLRETPDDAMALFRRGQCFFCLSRYKDAISDLDRAVMLEPEISSFYLWRGTAHAKSGDDHSAIDDYQRAMTLDPSLVAAYKARTSETSHPSSTSDELNAPNTVGADPETKSMETTAAKTVGADCDGGRASAFAKSQDILPSETKSMGTTAANPKLQNSSIMDLGYSERAVNDYAEAMKRILENRK